MTRRIFVSAIALLAVMVSLHYPRSLRAQSLSLPTYTTSQAGQGKKAYEGVCAACHGTNLDDGEFAPPLKGVDFRLRWGGKSVEALFSEMTRTMPPGSPGTLGDDTYAQLLAYVIQENGVIATARELPSDPALLRTAMWPASAGGPAGGLTIGVAIPPPPSRSSPLDRLPPVADAVLETSHRGGRL